MSLRLDVLLLLVGMSLVTYIPRMLPAAFIDKFKIGGKVEKFLKLIPYTAMAALIFPGILTVNAEMPWIGIIGGAVAALLAWRKCPMIVCVLGAIASNILIYAILPLLA
jgi:branched-subunit amino acid transport protein